MDERLKEMAVTSTAHAVGVEVTGRGGEKATADDQLEKVLLADTVERHKPAREAYEYAARELGVKAKEIVLVAAHAWDVAGAMAAGCGAAFVERPEKVPNPGNKKPQFQAGDITALAEQIVAKHGA